MLNQFCFIINFVLMLLTFLLGCGVSSIIRLIAIIADFHCKLFLAAQHTISSLGLKC